MDILPIPEDLIFLHGLLKLGVATVGFVLLLMTLKKHIQKRSRISELLLLTFACMAFGMMFASFDDLLGWDDLLGSETWLGFGLAQILNSLANISYFALYIEIFLVKENWEQPHKEYFLGFAMVDLAAAILIMGYYTFGWQVYAVIIPSIVHMVMATVLFTLWIITSTRMIQKIDDDQIGRAHV